MIASVHGVVKHLAIGSAVIEVGGVGILVNIPASLAAEPAIYDKEKQNQKIREMAYGQMLADLNFKQAKLRAGG